MRRFEYLVPDSLEGASKLCGEGATMPKAGGVDLLDRMKEGLERPTRIVALNSVIEKQIRRVQDDDSLFLGAGVTLADIGRNEVMRGIAPSVAQAAGEAATPQVREMATLGGNLLQLPRCWYLRSRHYHCLRKGGGTCWAQEGRHEAHALFGNDKCAVVHPSNLAPALVSLEAEVEVLGADGRSRMPLHDLWIPAKVDPQRENVLAPEEIVTGVIIPARSLGARAAHVEIRQKQSNDWPLAIAAVSLNGDKPRLVIGAVDSVPRIIKRATRVLKGIGDRPSATDLDALAEMAVRRATPLEGNGWRLSLIKAAVRRAVLKAAGVPEEQW